MVTKDEASRLLLSYCTGCSASSIELDQGEVLRTDKTEHYTVSGRNSWHLMWYAAVVPAGKNDGEGWELEERLTAGMSV
jgi:hypothetical protein